MRELPCPQKGAGHRRHARGLILPLREVTNELALRVRGVDPVDPGPPRGRVHRSGPTENEDRDPVAPRAEDGHRRVHEPDRAVDRRGHRAPGELRVAVGDGHRDLFVVAEDERRAVVGEVVDDAVVQPAKRRPRHERDVRDAKPPQHLGRDVRAPLRRGRTRGDDRRDVAEAHRSRDSMGGAPAAPLPLVDAPVRCALHERLVDHRLDVDRLHRRVRRGERLLRGREELRLVFAGPNSGIVFWDPKNKKVTGRMRGGSGLPSDKVYRLEVDTMVDPPILHVSTELGATSIRILPRGAPRCSLRSRRLAAGRP